MGFLWQHAIQYCSHPTCMRGNAILLCVGVLHKSEVALTCTPDWHTRTYFLHFIGYYVVARRQIDLYQSISGWGNIDASPLKKKNQPMYLHTIVSVAGVHRHHQVNSFSIMQVQSITRRREK